MICPNEQCDGTISRDLDVDYVTFRCDACDTEWAVHIAKASPDVRRQTRLEQAGIPSRFLGRPLVEDEHNRNALFACRAWLADVAKRDPLPGPAVYGPPGTGKSHLLSAVCVRLIREQDQRVLFRSARQLMRDLQDFDGQHDAAWRAASTVPVLALDDLGAQRDTDWRGDQLADLIDERYQRELVTVLASNFPPQAWRDELDARTASRLSSLTFPVELKGPDRRQMPLTNAHQTEGAPHA